MALQTHAWEKVLLSLAQEAYHQKRVVEAPRFDQDLLLEAYQHCNRMTHFHSRSFYLASALLPPPKRKAARALYAFCRVSDDIVDCAQVGPPSQVSTRDFDDVERLLFRWRRCAVSGQPPRDNLVAVAWTDTQLRFEVPIRYAEQLIDGVARDLAQNRYEEFSDLAAYCYGVASTVGLMSMHIIGYSSSEAIPYAIKLGVALQITNILRDIAEDFQVGRIYLPQAELGEFGLSDHDVKRGVETGVVTDRWRRFMRFQIARNRNLYAEAMPGIHLLKRDGQFAIRAAADLYQAILTDIEQNDYNVFARRAHVSTAEKLRMLPGIWWRTRSRG